MEGSLATQARFFRVDLPIKGERYQRVDVDKEHFVHEDQEQTDSCFYGETTKKKSLIKSLNLMVIGRSPCKRRTLSARRCRQREEDEQQ